MSIQAIAKASNASSLVIGEITDAEAALAQHDHPMIDGQGLYLISVDDQSQSGIGSVLAKFVSEDAASELAKFFRLSGRLEAA